MPAQHTTAADARPLPLFRTLRVLLVLGWFCSLLPALLCGGWLPWRRVSRSASGLQQAVLAGGAALAALLVGFAGHGGW